MAQLYVIYVVSCVTGGHPTAHRAYHASDRTDGYARTHARIQSRARSRCAMYSEWESRPGSGGGRCEQSSSPRLPFHMA